MLSKNYFRAAFFLLSLTFLLLLSGPVARAGGSPDFTITSPTTAIGAGTPSRAISLTVSGGAVGGSTASFTFSDGGAGGTFYPSSVTISANAAIGTVTQFIYIPAANASGTITIQAVASGGIATTHTLALPIGTATKFVNDTFIGTAGTNLSGHTPDLGSTWLDVDPQGLTLDLNGSGGVYTTDLGHVYSEYLIPTAEPQENDVCETISNFNSTTTIVSGLTDFAQNINSLNGYRFVYSNGLWSLISYANNGGGIIVNSTSSFISNGGSANMCISVRVINSLQYVIPMVNGALLSNPVQDNTFTTGYAGIIPETPNGQTPASTDSVQSNFYGANVDWSLPHALSISSPASVPANHSGNITITLSGTSTTWVNTSTIFTISGVANVTKVSQHVSSSTSATVVITTGNATGTLTISDGTNSNSILIAKPSISISPNQGVMGSTTTLALTGTNTVWTQETAAGLFTVSGGVGASITTPTISTDTQASALLTVGTGAGPLVITDNSTGATTTFTPNNIVSFPNANIYESPDTWISSGTTVIAPTGGAYLKFKVSGTQNISALVDTTLNNGLSAGNMPTIKVNLSVGTSTAVSSTWVEFPANDTSSTNITLASGLDASTTYNVTLDMIGANQGDTPGYNGTTFQTKINSLQFDANASLSSANLRPNSCMFWGDSILESYFGGDNPGGATGTYEGIVDFSQAWPSYVASGTLNCEYGQTGVGSQGWVNPGQGNYPIFGSSWNQFDSSQSISFSPAPTYAVIDEGTNDHLQATTTIATNVQTTLTAMRSTFGTSTTIFVVTPYNPTFGDGSGAPRIGIIDGFNAYQTASGGDAKTFLIDLNTSAQAYTLSPNSLDNIHPDIAAHAQIASLISTDMQPDLPSISASSSNINAGTTGNIIHITGANTSWASGTPGTPTFTLSGGTGASITAQTIVSSSSANLTVSAGTAVGVLTITDPSSRAVATITVNATTSTAPQSLSATAGDTQVGLTWSSPLSIGGSAITKYLIYDRLTGTSTFAQVATTSPSQTTATITGLVDNQSYDFEVLAQNGIGTSTASNIVSSIPVVQNTTPPIVVQVGSGGGGGGGGGGGAYIPPVSNPASSSATTTIVTTSSTSDLQNILAGLMVQLNNLLAQAKAQGITITTNTTTSGASTFIFSRNLKLLDINNDVEMLQEYLNTHGFIIASTGPGSPGSETDKFGAKTYYALIAFQKKYGISPASGYFGPITRAYVNAHE